VADVQPFRGLRYNLERIGDISAVISPPYDIISPQEQEFYYKQSPYNVVRLEFESDEPCGSPQSNKYARAADRLKGWLKTGILFREPTPVFYILEHRFIHQGIMRQRWGLTARVRLDQGDKSGARPHEVVLEKHIGDRLSLLRSCQVNFSPVMGIVRKGLLPFFPQLARDNPDLSAVDPYGVTHNLWVVAMSKALPPFPPCLVTRQSILLTDTTAMKQPCPTKGSSKPLAPTAAEVKTLIL